MRDIPEKREPFFEQQWFAGTYVISGVYFFNGTCITPSDIRESIEPLFLRTQQARRGPWPRGLAGYFIIPIYCAVDFDWDVISTVHHRLRHRWAIWPEPVLYFTGDNSVERRADYGISGSAYRPHLNIVMATGVALAGQMWGHHLTNRINLRLKSKLPNQLPEPTLASGTPPAEQEPRPR